MRSLHSRLKDHLHYGSSSGRITFIATGKEATENKGNGTVIIKIGKKVFKAEEMAIFLQTGAWPEHFVGFRNNDPQDLKYRNLHQHQGRGKPQKMSGDKSGVVGVIWHKPTQKWRARFQYKSKEYCCGEYYKIEIARMALNTKKMEVGAPIYE